MRDTFLLPFSGAVPTCLPALTDEIPFCLFLSVLSRQGLLLSSEQRVRELMLRQDSVRAQMEAERQEWQARLDEVELHWRSELRGVAVQISSGIVSTQSELC